MSRKFLACLGLVLTTSAHATTILAVYTPEAVYVASDSRIVSANGTFVGDMCKIHAYKDLVWAAAGPVVIPRLGFDIARTIALNVDAVPGDAPSFSDKADAIEMELEKLYPSLRTDLMKQGMPV